jgi:hypothetical protein
MSKLLVLLSTMLKKEDVDGLVAEAEDADITQEEEDVGHAPGMD